MSLEAGPLAVMKAIHEAGIGLSRGVNLFTGPLRPGKTMTCFCAATGGPSPSLLSGGGQAEIQTVQVQVWSPIDEAEAGEDLARLALRAVHRRRFGGYYHAEVREAAPVPIGRDDSGRNGYGFNVELHGLREVS